MLMELLLGLVWFHFGSVHVKCSGAGNDDRDIVFFSLFVFHLQFCDFGGSVFRCYAEFNKISLRIPSLNKICSEETLVITLGYVFFNFLDSLPCPAHLNLKTTIIPD